MTSCICYSPYQWKKLNCTGLRRIVLRFTLAASYFAFGIGSANVRIDRSEICRFRVKHVSQILNNEDIVSEEQVNLLCWYFFMNCAITVFINLMLKSMFNAAEMYVPAIMQNNATYWFAAENRLFSSSLRILVS